MSDNDKLKATEAAGMGCVGLYVLIQIGIPILLFIVLLLAVGRGCARMFQ